MLGQKTVNNQPSDYNGHEVVDCGQTDPPGKSINKGRRTADRSVNAKNVIKPD